MLREIAVALTNESRWILPSVVLAIVVAVVSLWKGGAVRPGRSEILRAMNLAFGCFIGLLAVGHLLAVALKQTLGTLTGSPVKLYLIGLVLAVPAWWLVHHASHNLSGATGPDRRAVALNAALGLFLLGMGPFNLPLAVPAALNVSYQFHRRTVAGWAIVAISVAGYLALLGGAMVFFASGGSFEQFQGME